MKKLLKVIFLVAVIVAPIWYFRADFQATWQRLENRYFFRPCTEPIYYSIGQVDERFNLSPQEFLEAVQAAENIWENAAGRNLFQFDVAQSQLRIGLVYDYRQDTTNKLSSLDQVLASDKSRFEQLKVEHDRYLTQYNTEVKSLKSAVAIYNAAAENYQEKVRHYNQRGGAPPAVYEELTKERSDLDQSLAQIRNRQAVVDDLADKINRLAEHLNELIEEYNLGVAQYNLIGEQIPPEYEQGNFTGGLDEGRIIVFQFSNRDKLVRVLAHELGHALGLDHIDDPEDIMYSLNIGENDRITAADLDALEEICSAPYGWRKLWADIKSFMEENI